MRDVAWRMAVTVTVLAGLMFVTSNVSCTTANHLVESVLGQTPRVGVFVCNCGQNIGSVVRVPEVAEYAKTLPMTANLQQFPIVANQIRKNKLRKGDICPVSDGASAMIICTVEKAKEWGKPYAVISGIDHIIESHNMGMRDLTDSVSTRKAAERAGNVELAEVLKHA